MNFLFRLEENINVEEEISKVKKEIDYTRGFLTSINKKLNNERFVSGAPEQVVKMEEKKRSDAEARMKVLEEQLAGLV